MCRGIPSSGAPPTGAPPRALFIPMAVCMFIVTFAVLLFTAIALWCRRRRGRTGPESEHHARHQPFPAVEALLPAYAYARDYSDGSFGHECSVCLGAVREGEMVRRLPACKHVYHAECIDRWLAAHRTCPLCRSELIDACKLVESDDRSAVLVQGEQPDRSPV